MTGSQLIVGLRAIIRGDIARYLQDINTPLILTARLLLLVDYGCGIEQPYFITTLKG